MSVDAVLIVGQIAWEILLIVILSAILATIWQVGTAQWKKINKSS